MVVAVPVVWVVEMSIDQVADVIAVGDGFMAAARPMNVAILMTSTVVTGSAMGRVSVVHFDLALIDVVAVGSVEVTVVQVADVIAVLDGGMTTIGAVGMGMVFVLDAAHGAPDVG